MFEWNPYICPEWNLSRLCQMLCGSGYKVLYISRHRGGYGFESWPKLRHKILIVRVRGMPRPKTGATSYHEESGLSDKGCTIKWFV